MRRLALSFVFLVLAPIVATAQTIETIIQDQLDAFNSRDVVGAFEFASPMIQSLFGTPERFGQMVQNGYPMVWTNSDARFVERQNGEGRALQRVLISDENGVPYYLDYEMIQTREGWRINGVRVVPAPQPAV